MSQLILIRGEKFHKSIFARFLPKNIDIGPFFLIVSLIVFVALITVMTLIFSTRQITKGYQLNSLEAQHQELVRDSEVHDMQISKVRALGSIETSAKVASMVRPREVVFVSGETSIASR